MALDHIRHEVAMMLAATDERVREAQARLAGAGGDADKVKAAGQLDVLLRQKHALEARRAELDAAPASVSAAMLERIRQEWFNLKQSFEHWVVER